MKYFPALLLVGLLAACAAQHADHFYSLTALPRPSAESRSAFTTQVRLAVTIPSLVDRNEMVLNSSAGIQVLEHERWASPLADQIKTVLGQDLEQRRPDSLVVTRPLARQNSPTVSVVVEIVSLTIGKDTPAALEARWRVQRAGSEATQGRDTFNAPAGNLSYADMAHALSACIGALADRLVQEWPASGG